MEPSCKSWHASNMISNWNGFVTDVGLSSTFTLTTFIQGNLSSRCDIAPYITKQQRSGEYERQLCHQRHFIANSLFSTFSSRVSSSNSNRPSLSFPAKLNLRRNSHLHAASMYSTNTQAVPRPLLNQRAQIINANVVYNALEHSFHRLESISARFVASHTNGLPTAFSPPRALQNEEKRIGVKPFPSWGNSVTVPKNDHSRRECTSIDSIHH